MPYDPNNLTMVNPFVGLPSSQLTLPPDVLSLLSTNQTDPTKGVAQPETPSLPEMPAPRRMLTDIRGGWDENPTDLSPGPLSRLSDVELSAETGDAQRRFSDAIRNDFGDIDYDLGFDGGDIDENPALDAVPDVEMSAIEDANATATAQSIADAVTAAGPNDPPAPATVGSWENRNWIGRNPNLAALLAILGGGAALGGIGGTFTNGGTLRGALRGAGAAGGAAAGGIGGGLLGSALANSSLMEGKSEGAKALATLLGALGGAGLGGYAGYRGAKSLSKSDEEEEEEYRRKYASLDKAYEEFCKNAK